MIFKRLFKKQIDELDALRFIHKLSSEVLDFFMNSIFLRQMIADWGFLLLLGLKGIITLFVVKIFFINLDPIQNIYVTNFCQHLTDRNQLTKNSNAEISTLFIYFFKVFSSGFKLTSLPDENWVQINTGPNQYTQLSQW